LVVFADDWGRHASSCQHLIRRLRHDYPVLWVNSIGTRQVRADTLTIRRGLEKLKNWSKGLKQVSDRMWVVDLPMMPGLGSRAMRAVNRRLVSWRLQAVLARLQMKEPVLLTTLPYMGWLVRDIPRRASIYYCTDDYSHWPSADGETLRQADREFSAHADLILAVSHALHASHDRAGRCRYFPHGVDVAHFGTAREVVAIPADLACVPGPRIGFFGLIYEKLDFELLEAVARRFPESSLVMIGSVVSCPEAFSALPNVHLLGPKPYKDLPQYVAGLDVLLLPYLADDLMIRQSGPLKLKECLATGKPTVSVDVPEVRILEPHVRVATDREAFLGHVCEALAEPADSPLVGARQEAIAQDDWDHRAEQLRSYLDELAPVVGAVAY
jgi:glycosyltransferase involved in cell wall biosynthesis